MMQMQNTIDTPILVTGAPRSGTSLVSNILAAHGVYFGDTKPKETTDEYNPRGYFENIGVRDGIVVPLLQAISGDGTGETSFVHPSNVTPQPWFRRAVIEEIKPIHRKLWAYKDPKSCLIWPVWDNAFPNAKWIVCRRDREEIAQSLRDMGNAHKIKNMRHGRTAADAYIAAIESMRTNKIEIWPSRLIDGDFKGIEKVFEFIGVEFDREKAEKCIDKKAWHGKTSCTTPSIHISSMHGLGDTMYQRPYVKELAKYGDVYIDTSWPEMYSDIDNVMFIKPTNTLRTQKKNYAKSNIKWVSPPMKPDRYVQFGYGGKLTNTNIPQTMADAARIYSYPEMGLPNFDCDFEAEKPIAFVRPVTERKEWLNKARNPKPEYVAAAINALKHDYHIVLVADTEEGQEWIIGDYYADTRLTNGELSMPEMMGLFQKSSVIVGGIGWILPAAIAAKKHAIIIGGGQLGHNALERLTNDHMDLSRIHYAKPTNGCDCVNMKHNCDKTIEGFDEWLSSTLMKLKK